jgi:DNA-binding MarR family transcriptional regulator
MLSLAYRSFELFLARRPLPAPHRSRIGEMALRVSGITHALSPLIRDGLVELLQDPADARTKHASRTTKGRARLRKAVEHWTIANQHVEKVMGSVNTAKLRELADQISVETFDLSSELGSAVGRRSKS